MTRTQIFNFVVGLLGGVEPDETTFELFLDIAQMNVEDARPWVYTRSSDSTQTISPSDTFQTQKTLSANFKLWFDEAPIQLLDASNQPIYLTEIPYSDRFAYQKAAQRFCVDYPNSKIYILGQVTQSYTILQNFTALTTLVSSSESAAWLFPERFHKILALMVAIYHRKGIDYDIFNNIQADNQTQQVGAIMDVMTRWDSSLQYNMQRGKDPFNSNSIGGGSTSGGFVNLG